MAADWEPYPDEQVKIAQVAAKLDDQFAFSYGNYAPDASDRRIFEAAVKSEFGKINIAAQVRWENMIGLNGLPAGVFRPHVELCGHIRDASETDHDRMKWGVVRGLEYGQQAGYVREDGSLREDPIKRDIL